MWKYGSKLTENQKSRRKSCCLSIWCFVVTFIKNEKFLDQILVFDHCGGNSRVAAGRYGG